MARFASCLALAFAACAPPAPATGPILLVDDGGHQVALAAPAHRIVSLVPATTELLFALGQGSSVVGRTRWCDYPSAALGIPSVGDGMQPNVEAITALGPDLVVAYRSPANGPAVDRLRALGTPVLEVAIDRLRDFERAARLLAAATGRPAAADTVTARVRDAVAAATVSPTVPVRVFALVWDQPPMTVGGGSFLTEIISRAGGRNVFGAESFPSFVVSIEAVMAKDPDVVLITGSDEPTWATRPEWQVVRAVRERRFVRVSGSAFDRPSPRVAEAIAALADSLAAWGRR